MSCIFCQIIELKSPAEIIYENDHVLSLLDILPINLGHTLVIPKKHFVDLTEVPGEIISEMFKAVKFLSPIVVNGCKADGFNVIVNNGTAAGQRVFHSHVHIIPRFNNDRLRFSRPEFMKYEKGQFNEYGSMLRNLVQLEQKNG